MESAAGQLAEVFPARIKQGSLNQNREPKSNRKLITISFPNSIRTVFPTGDGKQKLLVVGKWFALIATFE